MVGRAVEMESTFALCSILERRSEGSRRPTRDDPSLRAQDDSKGALMMAQQRRPIHLMMC